MYVNRIFLRPEPITEYKDGLHKVPVWAMRILLVLTFAFYGFFATKAAVASVPYMIGNFDISLSVALPIVSLISGALSLVVFEVIGSVYYSFIRPLCPPIGLNREAFMVYARAAYVLRNLVGGLIKLVYIKGDLYFFTLDPLICLVVTTAVYIVAYLYVNKHYVPDGVKAPFLRVVAFPYIIYQAVTLVAGLMR